MRKNILNILNNPEIEPNRAVHATMAEPAALSALKLIKSILAMVESLTSLGIPPR